MYAAIAQVCADEYDPMQGASSMKSACKKVVAEITAGSACGKWNDALSPDWDSTLKQLWLHVPDMLGTKEVAVAKDKPPESEPSSPQAAAAEEADGDSDDEF